MAKEVVSNHGRKRPQILKNIELLHLDNKNPRLSEQEQGRSEEVLFNVLYNDFCLDELAESMAKNGYFDEEPLVAVPSHLPDQFKEEAEETAAFITFINDSKTELIVVEGNRRLAAAKLLLDISLRKKLRINHWPILSEEIEKDLKLLPVIVYSKRIDVVPYLGVRHIVGIQKWDSYAKARYLARLIEDGMALKDVQARFGDKSGAIPLNVIGYKLLEQVENEYGYDTKKAKSDFSLLVLAINQGKIKRFLGFPKKLVDVDPSAPVKDGQLDNLKYLVSWLFGDGKQMPVIHESRDITNYLSNVIESPEAINYLKSSGDLIGAYDRSAGEENMLMKYLGDANNKLEKALSVVQRHKTPEVIAEIEKCENTINALLEVAKGSNDRHS